VNAPDSTARVVRLEKVTVERGGTVVLRDVSVNIAPGDFVAIVGPNGSGKSTLLQTLLGYVPAQNGSIFLFATPLPAFRDWARIGYLPQTPCQRVMDLPVTALEVVATGLLASKVFPKRWSRGDRQKVVEALAAVGMEALAQRRIGELSGGQRQRIYLARALVNRPELLILDEPTAAMDPAFRGQFYELLHRLHESSRTTILLVTHDSSGIGVHAKRLLYLDQRVVFWGTFKDFCASPEMTSYFGAFQQHQICHQHDRECRVS
jgi:zinc transport system ATP-binding protein